MWQRTPDGGETRFAYDKLGRIIASQNAKQAIETIVGSPTQVLINNGGINWGYNYNIDLNDPNKLLRQGGGLSGWNSGALCDQVISGDGFFETTVNDDSDHDYIMFGLSENGELPDYIGITYKWYFVNIMYPSATYDVQTRYNDGSEMVKSSKYLGVTIGDKLRVERKDNYIIYKHNGIATDSIIDLTGGADLKADFSIYNNSRYLYQPTIGYTTNQYEKFSYTTYDDLGRISEAGEMRLPNGQYVIDDDGKLIHTGNGESNFGDQTSFPYNVTNITTQVTKTTYDSAPNAAVQANFVDYNLLNNRNRVTRVDYYTSGNQGTPDSALYYNYDIHGNVEEMLTFINDPFLTDQKKEYFSVYYDYDLISGNVNEVTYQKGKQDMFIHCYAYDADNRILNVKTSKDGIIWEQDATYDYY